MFRGSLRLAAQAAGAATGQLPKQIETNVVRFRSFGKPADVLRLEKEELSTELKGSDVLVRMLAAPIHPADLNIVEGVYPNRPSLPAVGGIEGVGVVLATGPDVQRIKPNTLVLPSGFGTWRSHAVCKEGDVMPIPALSPLVNLPYEHLAALSVGPLTALRLLEDFASLKPGDVLIQNAANGMVGSVVMQLAEARGIKTINIVRRRPGFELTVQRLQSRGAFVVVPDDYVRTAKFRDLIADLPKPRLALDGLGGPSATELARNLADGGVMVTYGAMTHKPVNIPPSLLIFRNIQLRGFWLTRWLQQHSEQERLSALEQLKGYIDNGKLKLWVEAFKLQDAARALQAVTSELRSHDFKAILTMKD